MFKLRYKFFKQNMNNCGMFEPTGEFCKIFKNCCDVVNRNKQN